MTGPAFVGKARSGVGYVVAAVLLLGASAVSWQLGLLVLFLEIAFVSAKRSGVELSKFFGALPRGLRLWRYYLSIGVLAQVSLTGLAILSLGLEVWLFPALGQFILENDPGSLLDRPAMAIGLGVIFMPILEECLFRGVLFRFLKYKVGFRTGLVVSSLLFGCAHAEPIGNSVFGAVLALVYVRTGGLTMPIVLHAAANAVALVTDHVTAAGDLAQSLDQFYGKEPLEVGAALFLIGLPFLVDLIRRKPAA